jgi:hypothetical protein
MFIEAALSLSLFCLDEGTVGVVANGHGIVGQLGPLSGNTLLYIQQSLNCE